MEISLTSALLIGSLIVVVAVIATAALVRSRQDDLAPLDAGPTTGAELVDQQVATMSAEVGELRGLVQDLRVDRAGQHGQLSRALAEAADGQQRLVASTRSLEDALSNSRSRGQWGERTADDILRHAGFVEGVAYVRQTAIAGGGIPDFTFFLPEGRVLHMDVKFPADNYLRSLRAAGTVDRQRYEKAFVSDVRARVKELADRGYTDTDDAYDTVLLFIPVEAIFGSMHELDAALLDEALGQGVVLCSPSSLFAVLAVIRRTVEDHAVERTSDEIVECLGSFGRQWEMFVDQMDKVAKQLGTVQASFDQLTGTRRNQLDRQLVRVDDLRSRRAPQDAPTALRA